MKKILIILILFQAFTFIYSNEDATSDKKHELITKEYGLGYYKGAKYLKTKNDFIKALSPIPQARELYLISQMWRTSAFVLLGTSIGTFVSFDVLAALTLIYGDKATYPMFYNPVLGLSFGFTALSLFALLIPQVIVMIVSFAKQHKKKKEAIILYNNMVKEFNNKTGVIFNASPYVSIDKNKEYNAGLIFSLRFN